MKKIIKKRGIVELSNSGDINYLNLKEKHIKSLEKILKYGLTLIVETKHYKNVKDKKNDEVSFYSRRKITKIKKLSYRDVKTNTYRVKLYGKTVKLNLEYVNSIDDLEEERIWNDIDLNDLNYDLDYIFDRYSNLDEIDGTNLKFFDDFFDFEGKYDSMDDLYISMRDNIIYKEDRLKKIEEFEKILK